MTLNSHVAMPRKEPVLYRDSSASQNIMLPPAGEVLESPRFTHGKTVVREVNSDQRNDIATVWPWRSESESILNM